MQRSGERERDAMKETESEKWSKQGRDGVKERLVTNGGRENKHRK